MKPHLKSQLKHTFGDLRFYRFTAAQEAIPTKKTDSAHFMIIKLSLFHSFGVLMTIHFYS